MRHDRAFLAAALLAAAALVPGRPAFAQDDLAAVQGRVAAAMGSAGSYVATTRGGGYVATTTYVAPDRYASTLNYAGIPYNVVLVGTQAYVSEAGGPWRTIAVPPVVATIQNELKNVPVDRLLPPTTVDGRTLGRFLTTSAGADHDQRLTCAYDLQSYRLVSCSNSAITISFDRYDDPANTIAIPTP